MLLLHQLKTWMYWKAKVRILQLWSNFKLYNLNNAFIVPVLSLIGPLIGIVLTFGLGFGLAYLYQHFISTNMYHIWQIVFSITIIEAIGRGMQNGRWISSTDEERWLLASTPLTTTRYLLFLWIDEEFWQNKTQFFSTLAFLVGVYILFPVHLGLLLMTLLLLTFFSAMLALLITLMQYYIIKRSVYLKGQGAISNILIPITVSIFVFYSVKYLLPQIMRFPKVRNNEYYYAYIDWIKGILDPFWGFLKQIATFFNYDYAPYSLFADFLLTRNLTALLLIGIYGGLLVVGNALLLKVIEGKVNKTMVRQTRLDQALLGVFMKVNGFFQLFSKSNLQTIHVKYFITALLQNYLVRRNILVVFGEKLWIYFGLIIAIIIYMPEPYKEKATLVIAVLTVVVYPTYILWKVYSKLKIKLSFDAEGKHLQVLMGYGASPAYIYQLKTRVIQVLAFPGYMLVLLLTLISLPISFKLKVGLLFLSVMIYFILANFVLLASFVLPHYEFFNKQQIGTYPDQVKGLDLVRVTINLLVFPGVPLLMYVTDLIHKERFLMMSLSWIMIGGVVAFLLMRNIYYYRLNHFHIEEVHFSRMKVIDEDFWKNRLLMIVITILIYIGSFSLTLIGEFLYAGLFYLIPMIIIRMTLLSSFRNAIVK